MSQENVDNLRAFLETWDRDGNIRAFVDAANRGEADMSVLDPKVTYEDTSLPDHVGETYRGHEGVIRATERWIEPYEELTSKLEKIVGTGNRLVSIHRIRARARAHRDRAGSAHRLPWTFRDGKVIHFKSSSPEEALEAAGLRG